MRIEKSFGKPVSLTAETIYHNSITIRTIDDKFKTPSEYLHPIHGGKDRERARKGHQTKMNLQVELAVPSHSHVPTYHLHPLTSLTRVHVYLTEPHSAIRNI